MEREKAMSELVTDKNESSQDSEATKNLAGKLPDDLKHWVETCGIESLSYTVYIYRIQKRSGVGQRGRLFVNQYDNFIPEFKDLGTTYGSGQYELFVRWYDADNKSQSKKLTITLDEYWDKIKEKAEKQQNVIQHTPQQPQQTFAEQFQQNLLMIRAITESISPILGIAKQNQQPQINTVDQFGQTMQMLGTMQNEMLTSNFKNQLELQNTMINSAGYSREPEGKEDTYISEIINVLGQFLPVLKMMGENQVRPVAKKYVDSDEKLKSVLNDPVRAQKAYDQLKAKHGEETANRAFRAFGMLKNDRLVDRQKSPLPEDIVPAKKRRTTKKAVKK